MTATREARVCYFIPADGDQYGKPGQFVPSLVTEGVAGHSPLLGRGEGSTPWFWGDYTMAQSIARQQNAKMGLTEDDVTEIVASSMRARR